MRARTWLLLPSPQRMYPESPSFPKQLTYMALTWPEGIELPTASSSRVYSSSTVSIRRAPPPYDHG